MSKTSQNGVLRTRWGREWKLVRGKWNGTWWRRERSHIVVLLKEFPVFVTWSIPAVLIPSSTVRPWTELKLWTVRVYIYMPIEEIFFYYHIPFCHHHPLKMCWLVPLPVDWKSSFPNVHWKQWWTEFAAFKCVHHFHTNIMPYINSYWQKKVN